MKKIRDAFILDILRTPLGKKNGAFREVRPDDLSAPLLIEVVKRNRIDPYDIDDVIFGCVTQIGEQGMNIARSIALLAGLPVEVPGATVHRFCASSLQAMNFAAYSIMVGEMNLVIAGGIEHMTRVPMGSDAGPVNEKILDRFDIIPQGLSAELIAERWGFKREELDLYSYESHRRAIMATDKGYFKREILPMEGLSKTGEKVLFDFDEGPRRDTSPEKLANLKPVFKSEGVITAGNSSQITDGAAVVLVSSYEMAEKLGMKPRARIVATQVVGTDPTIMLTGPIPATKKILEKCNFSITDIDLYEVNEAFAPVPMAWSKEIGVSYDILNIHGGAIALGHPIGASGTRLIVTLLNSLEIYGLKRGLATLCTGYGMAVATIIERV